MSDAAAFIKANLRLEPVPGLSGIRLYTAHSGSRLSRLADDEDAPPPYWAYQWAGGLALAQHFRREPGVVRGKRVLDLGAGSGLVAIAAAQVGATAFAAEIDPHGRAAIGLNAEANGVAVELIDVDLAGEPPGGIDVIAAGDVFYNAEVAVQMLPFLERCARAGLSVLVGDPDRRDLPLDWLTEIAAYPVGDVGDTRTNTERVGRVYALTHQQTSS
ncbi:class I SAM-dependent methyltransferase [Devosia naphthalenivorans]|uniref:class I SAM-dependent methyltransferase n=1 Tax=Devosia naphthalenivorans TaxID=2082392 RepID=UPI000D397842|nr:50S ribosomal protein L11 methyltransferase [Devosia naphthalenivorans]